MDKIDFILLKLSNKKVIVLRMPIFRERLKA